MLLLDFGEHVMRCFKGIYFLFVPLLCWIPSNACFLVRVEERWHLQRLFRAQPVSLPICCTWETSLEEGKRMANLWLHLVSQILHRAAFNLSSCSEPSAVPVVTAFTTTFTGVCNRNVVWIFCDCNSGNLQGQWILRSSLRQDLNWYLVGALKTISKRYG